MERSRGIIIRLTRLTESSVIVHWCMEQDGLIKTVAKGARRPKSAFAGKLDLFFEAEVGWVRSRKSELHTLRELEVGDYREGLRVRYRDTVLAAYFVDLLTSVAEPDHPVPELYDLLRRGLGYIGREGADLRAMLHYEKELVRLLGVQHHQLSPLRALERAFGFHPKGRSACLEMLGG